MEANTVGHKEKTCRFLIRKSKFLSVISCCFHVLCLCSALLFFSSTAETTYIIKFLDGLTHFRLAARQIFFPFPCKLFNSEHMHYSFLKLRSLSGSCLAGEDCLFLIEIISRQEKSCPCEKSDFLAMHQSAEEERRGREVERGNCMNTSFFCYTQDKQLLLQWMTANCCFKTTLQSLCRLPDLLSALVLLAISNLEDFLLTLKRWSLISSSYPLPTPCCRPFNAPV